MPLVRKVRIQIKESEIRDAGGLENLIANRLRRGALVATEILRGDLARNSPVNTGTLANSFISQPPIVSRRDVSMSITMIPYGRFVVDGHGGKGKSPPFDVISLWVKRKGLHQRLKTAPWMAQLLPETAQEGNAARHKNNKFILAEKLIIATLLVMRKIARAGVEANNFLDLAIKNNRERMLRAIQKGLGAK